jgi:hypothetical protein
VYNIFTGNTEGKMSLGRPRHRWGNTIKLYLNKIRWGGIGSNDPRQGLQAEIF